MLKIWILFFLWKEKWKKGIANLIHFVLSKNWRCYYYTKGIPNFFFPCSEIANPNDYQIKTKSKTKTLTLAIRIVRVRAQSWRRRWWAQPVGCWRCWTSPISRSSFTLSPTSTTWLIASGPRSQPVFPSCMHSQDLFFPASEFVFLWFGGFASAVSLWGLRGHACLLRWK